MPLPHGGRGVVRGVDFIGSSPGSVTASSGVEKLNIGTSQVAPFPLCARSTPDIHMDLIKSCSVSDAAF